MTLQNRINRYVPMWGSWKIKEIIHQSSAHMIARVTNGEEDNLIQAFFIQSRNFARQNNIAESDVLNAITSECEQSVNANDSENHIKCFAYFTKEVKINNIFQGYDVVIRMKNADCLNASIRSGKSVPEDRTFMMINDISTALSVSGKNGDYHGNIAPEFIFFDERNFYISNVHMKKMTASVLGMQYRSVDKNLSEYQSDIFSLGIIAYTLLNGNKMPVRNAMMALEPISGIAEDRMKLVSKMTNQGDMTKYDSHESLLQELNSTVKIVKTEPEPPKNDTAPPAVPASEPVAVQATETVQQTASVSSNDNIPETTPDNSQQKKSPVNLEKGGKSDSDTAAAASADSNQKVVMPSGSSGTQEIYPGTVSGGSTGIVSGGSTGTVSGGSTGTVSGGGSGKGPVSSGDIGKIVGGVVAVIAVVGVVGVFMLGILGDKKEKPSGNNGTGIADNGSGNPDYTYEKQPTEPDDEGGWANPGGNGNSDGSPEEITQAVTPPPAVVTVTEMATAPAPVVTVPQPVVTVPVQTDPPVTVPISKELQYGVSYTACSWNDANIAATSSGVSLATFSTEAEWNRMVAAAEQSGLRYLWIGGVTELSDNDTKVSAHWVDPSVDSTLLTDYFGGKWFYNSNLDIQEPSGFDYGSGSKEPYLMLWKINGSWSLCDNSDEVLRVYKNSDIGYLIQY